ncbi:MAG: Gfo/Idh/MocA family oxidoreductase [Salinibacterium sp.]|nr:Gfo/Idh/MocA family oxidoreductase [Salinibacterium sp.]
MANNVPPSTGTLIRAAIVGYGLSGRVFHSPFLESDSNFELAAIVTGDDARRAQASGEHRNARIYQSFEELESSGESFDLIVLAGPPDTHRELALKALAMGAAVIVDKPFVASTEDAQLLIDAATVAGRPLMVFHNRRWDGDFVTIQSLIRSGRLGDVFHFESNFEHWSPTTTPGWKDQLPASRAGGVAWDLGSHLVDQALVLFGPTASVTSRLRTVREGGGNDDHAEIHIVHESGVVSRLLMSRLSDGHGPRFRLLGTRGSFISFGLDPQEPALDAGALPTDEGFGTVSPQNYGTLTEHTAGGSITSQIPTEPGDYAEFYRRVAAAVRGTGPEPVRPEEALDVVAVLELATRTPTNAN